MGWLQRLFNINKPQSSQARQSQTSSSKTAAATSSQESIPPERVGLNGEYDRSGLAKRVALAFDEDPNLDDIDTLYVAQTGSTVVLKGKAPDRQTLDQMVSAAKKVKGATGVDTSGVTVG